jgi:hypothetical protein
LVYIASSYPALQRWKQNNLTALHQITCGEETCDARDFTTDWLTDEPDYVVFTNPKGRYLIDFPTSKAQDSERFAPLDYFDTRFIRNFREPSSWNTPDGEIWRLYSREVRLAERTDEILIGYAIKAPWRIVETPELLVGTVDATLKREADKLATYDQNNNQLKLGPRPALSSDGFVIVDASTNQVVISGPWVPAYMPLDISFPSPGYRFYRHRGQLYVLHTAMSDDGRLLAASLVPIGNLWWLLLVCASVFLSMSVLARALSRRYLRRYFALLGIQVPSLEEALRIGEGPRVEFKRGLSDEVAKSGSVDTELLKSITAFANTNDGAILIGIDDAGRVKGLDLDFKGRDAWERRIHQLVRTRIKPTPPIQVAFEELRGMPIGKISVARGEAPVYMLDGVVYLRQGSSDVQAQPDDIVSLVAEFAF